MTCTQEWLVAIGNPPADNWTIEMTTNAIEGRVVVIKDRSFLVPTRALSKVIEITIVPTSK